MQLLQSLLIIGLIVLNVHFFFINLIKKQIRLIVYIWLNEVFF